MLLRSGCELMCPGGVNSFCSNKDRIMEKVFIVVKSVSSLSKLDSFGYIVVIYNLYIVHSHISKEKKIGEHIFFNEKGKLLLSRITQCLMLIIIWLHV